MPDLFGNLLAEIYSIWQQNGNIPSSVKRGAVVLLRKDPDKGDAVENFRPITLLNADFKILARVLAKRLALVVSGLIGRAQTCAIPGRSIHDNLHLTRYIFDRVASESGLGGALINLDQSKAFDRVDHQYLAAVLRAAGLGPVFRGWVTKMYSNVSSVVMVNGYCSEPFPISRSVRQGCPLSPLLYALAIEPLLRKIDNISGIPRELGHGMCVSAYADDVTVIVSDVDHIDAIGTIIKGYERVSGASINHEKSVCLRLGSWRGRPMPPDSVAGHWTDGPVKMLGVWFGPDLQVERNWDEVTSRVANLIQKWNGRKLSLKGRAEVVKVYIAPAIYYRLALVPCPKNRLNELERVLFKFLWNGRKPLVRRSICCQDPLNGGLGMPWLLLRKHAQRLRHLQRFLSGEQVWSPFTRHAFPQLVSLVELQSWLKQRPSFGEWHTECREALRLFCRTGNAVGGDPPTSVYYKGLVRHMSDDDLGERLGVSELQLSGLFRRTFGPGPMDNFQRSLAWQLYRGALPVRDKLKRHGCAVTRICQRCMQAEETPLHALVQFPNISPLWIYVEQLLLRMGWVSLTTESIIRIMPPPSFCKEGRAAFLCLVAVAKEIVWWTRYEGWKGGTYLSGDPLVNFFRHHLKRRLRVERRVLPPNQFAERWMNVACLVRVNGPTLNMRF
ncbi:hypothetical protein Ahia01_000009400 [Argonauta hians]